MGSEMCIRDSHSDGRYVFWPDLANAHYAKATTALLDHLDIPFVPKELNPPNVPELRPIENFWSLLKSAVYAGGWEASGEDQLRRKIRKCLKELDLTPVQRDFSTVKTRIRCYGNGGFASVHK